MIKVTHFTKTSAKRSRLSDLRRDGLNWIDCKQPSNEEITKLENVFGFKHSDIHNALDETERSRVEVCDGYSYILFKAPDFSKSILVTTTVGIFLKDNNVITLHKKNIKSINDLFNSSDLVGHRPIYLIQKLLRLMINNFFVELEQLGDKIEDLEDKAVKPSSRKVMVEISQTKKSLIYFHNSLVSNREAVISLREGRAFVLTKSDVGGFIEIHNDVLQLIDITTTYMELLSNATEVHMSAISNAMNDIVKRLTVIASFTLIPTMIASIYGMNFGQDRLNPGPFNMPELDWTFGYPFAMALMFASIIIMAAYFYKKKWY